MKYWLKPKDDRRTDRDLEPVEPEDTERWMRDTQERWFALTKRHPERAPGWCESEGSE